MSHACKYIGLISSAICVNKTINLNIQCTPQYIYAVSIIYIIIHLLNYCGQTLKRGLYLIPWYNNLRSRFFRRQKFETQPPTPPGSLAIETFRDAGALYTQKECGVGVALKRNRRRRWKDEDEFFVEINVLCAYVVYNIM